MTQVIDLQQLLHEVEYSVSDTPNHTSLNHNLKTTGNKTRYDAHKYHLKNGNKIPWGLTKTIFTEGFYPLHPKNPSELASKGYSSFRFYNTNNTLGTNGYRDSKNFAALLSGRWYDMDPKVKGYPIPQSLDFIKEVWESHSILKHIPALFTYSTSGNGVRILYKGIIKNELAAAKQQLKYEHEIITTAMRDGGVIFEEDHQGSTTAAHSAPHMLNKEEQALYPPVESPYTIPERVSDSNREEVIKRAAGALHTRQLKALPYEVDAPQLMEAPIKWMPTAKKRKAMTYELKGTTRLRENQPVIGEQQYAFASYSTVRSYDEDIEVPLVQIAAACLAEGHAKDGYSGYSSSLVTSTPFEREAVVKYKDKVISYNYRPKEHLEIQDKSDLQCEYIENTNDNLLHSSRQQDSVGWTYYPETGTLIGGVLPGNSYGKFLMIDQMVFISRVIYKQIFNKDNIPTEATKLGDKLWVAGSSVYELIDVACADSTELGALRDTEEEFDHILIENGGFKINYTALNDMVTKMYRSPARQLFFRKPQLSNETADIESQGVKIDSIVDAGHSWGFGEVIPSWSTMPSTFKESFKTKLKQYLLIAVKPMPNVMVQRGFEKESWEELNNRLIHKIEPPRLTAPQDVRDESFPEGVPELSKVFSSYQVDKDSTLEKTIMDKVEEFYKDKLGIHLRDMAILAVANLYGLTDKYTDLRFGVIHTRMRSGTGKSSLLSMFHSIGITHEAYTVRSVIGVNGLARVESIEELHKRYLIMYQDEAADFQSKILNMFIRAVGAPSDAGLPVVLPHGSTTLMVKPPLTWLLSAADIPLLASKGDEQLNDRVILMETDVNSKFSRLMEKGLLPFQDDDSLHDMKYKMRVATYHTIYNIFNEYLIKWDRNSTDLKELIDLGKRYKDKEQLVEAPTELLFELWTYVHLSLSGGLILTDEDKYINSIKDKIGLQHSKMRAFILDRDILMELARAKEESQLLHKVRTASNPINKLLKKSYEENANGGRKLPTTVKATNLIGTAFHKTLAPKGEFPLDLGGHGEVKLNEGLLEDFQVALDDNDLIRCSQLVRAAVDILESDRIEGKIVL